MEHFEIIDAEFGGEYVMVAPEAEDITQEFSRSHQALDIAAPAGSPVLAADEGTVTTVQVWDGSKSTEDSQSYGHLVQVKHQQKRHEPRFCSTLMATGHSPCGISRYTRNLQAATA